LLAKRVLLLQQLLVQQPELFACDNIVRQLRLHHE
jgi:hypothetical protein